MHCLVALFLEMIALAIILLVVGHVIPHVLVIASTMIMALVISMTMIRLAIVASTWVASMVVAIFLATVLLVARFVATRGRNISRILFLWLLLVLGNLLENANRLVGCLTLLEEGNHSERVGRHRLVQVGKLVLVCLRLCKEDLFTLLLRRGCVHRLTEVVALEVAEKLYLTTHELMHWHESRLLGRTKPANQLVTNIGEPRNGFKVVPDTFVKFFLHRICIFWTSLCNDAGPFGQAYILKTLTH